MELGNVQFLRLDEVLKLCAISKSHLYREIAAGRFPRPVRVGRRAIRWRLHEVVAWIESRPQVAEETWT